MAEEFLTDIIAQESKNTESPKIERTEDNSESSTSSLLVGATEGSALVETKDDKTSENADGAKTQLTIEDLATQLGWNPNFQGEGAIDASTYILRSKDIQESMKNHNKDLKKAGLTAAKTVGEWVGIGKGEAKPYTLKINGEEKTVKPVNSEVEWFLLTA